MAPTTPEPLDIPSGLAESVLERAKRAGCDHAELRVENELSDAVLSEHPGTAGGYGLAGMHERLRLIDGELQAGLVGDRWVVRARVTR